MLTTEYMDSEIFLTWPVLAAIRSYTVNIEINMDFSHLVHFLASEGELGASIVFLVHFGSMSASLKWVRSCIKVVNLH